MLRVFTLIAMLVMPCEALRMPPLATTRRGAVAAGVSLVPALVLPANADTIEEIAARSNAKAKEDQVAKEKAKADKKARVAPPLACLGVCRFGGDDLCGTHPVSAG